MGTASHQPNQGCNTQVLNKGPENRMVLQANSNAKSNSIHQWIRKAPCGSHTVITSVNATGLNEGQLTGAFEKSQGLTLGT